MNWQSGGSCDEPDRDYLLGMPAGAGVCNNLFGDALRSLRADEKLWAKTFLIDCSVLTNYTHLK